MPPKTERMEMRLDEETLLRVDNWRSNQDDLPSRSEAMRRLVEIGLESGTQEGFRLSKTEKLMTWMLSEVMKNQINERKNKADTKYDLKTVDLIQEAIYGGHFWALQWEMTGVMHDHTDNPKAVRATANILDTWSFIEDSYAVLSYEEKSRIEHEVEFFGKNPRFSGFDGNNESEYLSIARFLVEKLDRFQSFKGRNFNSHAPTLLRYQRMSAAFEPMRVNLIGRGLSADQIIALLQIR